MSRERLLAAPARRVESIEVEGIGMVHLRVLTGRESLALLVALREPERGTAEGLAALCAAQLAAFVSDEAGAPVLSFDDAQRLLDAWRAVDVRRVIAKGKELNALDDDAVERAGKN